MQIKLLQTDWTQEQKNLTHAAVAYLLHQMVVSFTGISVLNGLVTIETDEGFELTEEDIFTRIQAHLAELALADAQEQATVEDIKSQVLDATTPEQVELLLQELKARMGG